MYLFEPHVRGWPIPEVRSNPVAPFGRSFACQLDNAEIIARFVRNSACDAACESLRYEGRPIEFAGSANGAVGFGDVRPHVLEA
jgi:hypothetical protein